MDSLVSIIMPSYNSSKYISESITSIIEQDYPFWELLIVDDGSKDNTVQIIKEWQDRDRRIRFEMNSVNSGAAFSRNRGIKMAKGKYIAFLDSDDLWYENKLSTQLRFMEDNNIAFSFASYTKIDENGKHKGLISAPPILTYNNIIKSCSIGCLTAVYNVDKLGKLYMDRIPLREDYTLWLKILKKEKFAYGILSPLGKYRVHKSSISDDKLKSAFYQWKVYRDIEKHSLFKSLYFFVFYGYYGIIKTYFK